MAGANLYAQQPSKGLYYAIRLKPGQDLKKEIIAFAKDKKIKAGAIVSCAGSLTAYNIRFANQEKGNTATGHFEIVSLSGTLSDTSSHLHISVSDETGRTIGGHLLDDNVIYTTAEIVIVDLTDLSFDRQLDSTFGYQELVVKKRND